MAARVTVPSDPAKEAEFDRAFEQLTELVDLTAADERHPVRGNAAYTTSVVLCMLIFQRMSPNTSLETAVKKLVKSRPDILPDNKRVREGRLSLNTGAYSQARTRMPLAAAEWLALQVSQSIIESRPPSLGDRRVFLIDGTTITLAPEPALQKLYPPASTQYGRGVWPVALLTVCHELGSGAAMIPEVGAMYGPNAVSETSLIEKNLARLPAGSVVMADAGFGIFAVAYRIHRAGHAGLLRMAQYRFESLRKRATLESRTNNSQTWRLDWRPSKKELATHPDLPPDAMLSVRLHEIVINDQLTLSLVTDLDDSADVLAELYEQRTHVETDLRNMKIVLNTENIRARSDDTFRKELLAAIVSYNLVIQFRAQAAALINEPPRRMSFKRTWTTFGVFLLAEMHTSPKEWREAYRFALACATQDKLPNRPGRRYPREAYPRRPKSNQFKKRTTKNPT